MLKPKDNELNNGEFDLNRYRNLHKPLNPSKDQKPDPSKEVKPVGGILGALRRQQELAEKDLLQRKPIVTAGLLYKQEALNRISQEIKQDRAKKVSEEVKIQTPKQDKVITPVRDR